ncbi:MAG TPA: serine/threonine-protein kinase [Candidatus Thermoplasmatota archaeon]|nr:serine/threonine-protein kinase [Candidatus Thermoplasmatota archaeon]
MAEALLVFQFASYVAVVLATGAAAVVLLAAAPRRNWNQWLAFFLLLVAGNFAAQAVDVGTDLWAIPDPVRVRALSGSLGRLFLIFDPAVLAYFAAIFPRRSGLAERAWGPALLAVPVVGFTVLEVGSRAFSRAPAVAQPEAFAFYAYLAACYTYAGLRLLRNLLNEPSTVMARQVWFVAFGVVVAAFSRVALIASDFRVGFETLTGPGATAPALELAVRLALLAALWVGMRAVVRRARASEHRRAEAAALARLAGLVFGAFAVLWTVERAVAALVAGGVAVPAILELSAGAVTHGVIFSVRWFVFTGAIMVGVVRYEVLSVDARALPMGATALAAAGGFLGLGAVGDALGPWAAASLAVLLVVAVGWALGRLAWVHESARTDGYLRERRLEVYRAALAAAVAAAEPSEAQRASLATVRARLGVSEREHEILLAIAQAEEAREQGPVLLGRYEVLRRLGSGGYATVYLARDGPGGRLVVLKRIREDMAGPRGALDAALRELEVARRVSHPGLVAVHDMVRLDDGAVVVMEFVEGGSLRDLLTREGRVSDTRVAALLNEALDALQALHDAGIVHGDVKPENLLLTHDGHVRLADFGAARSALAGRTLVGAMASGGSGPGTLRYMAPEQALGQAATPRSDLYSLGAVACEALTGAPYVDDAGRSAYDVLRRVVEGTPGAAAMPVRWKEFLAGALARDPAARFPSAAAMRAALGARWAGDAGRARASASPRRRA